MEEAITLRAGGKRLYGILHAPEAPAHADAALLMVVGGPQTRVGSHRSYTLIARELCRRGMTVLRFDYEGLGDSEGAFVGFTEAGASLDAAVDFLAGRLRAPARIVLWSLCDGSAACALHAPRLKREVAGMILCNPYAHSAAGKAKAYLKHYYLQRVLDLSFWKKLLSFRVNPLTVAASFAGLVAKAGSKSAPAAPGSPATAPAAAAQGPALRPNQEGVPGADPEGLADRVMDGLEGYAGPLELILSAEDLTAREFLDLYKARGTEGRRKRRTAVNFVPGADHTFTEAAWKAKACDLTGEAWNRILQPQGVTT